MINVAVKMISMRLIWRIGLVSVITVFALFGFGAKTASASGLIKPPNNLGLVGYWSFEDATGTVATDFSGNGNAVLLYNSPAWRTGRFGKALYFDGVNQYASTTSIITPSIYGTLPRTISFWFNADSFDTSTNDMMLRAGNGTTGEYLGIFAEDNGVSVGFSGHRVIFGKNTLSINTWNHFALVIAASSTSGSVTGYLNGAQSALATEAGTSLTINTVADTIDIGTDSGIAGYFAGFIDDIRIYNRALSATEVLALSSSGSQKIRQASDQGLVGYWSFEDATGTLATDFSGNGNTGTLTGMEGSDWVTGKRGWALSFDGAGDEVINLGDFADSLGEMTASAWIKKSVTGANQGIISKCNNTGTGAGWGFMFGTPGTYDTISFFTQEAGGAKWNQKKTINTYADGQWHHVVATLSGGISGTILIYVDGISQALTDTSVGGAFSSNSTSEHVFIGGMAGDTKFNGLIDDVRLYNRALSAAEILKIYQTGDYKLNASMNTRGPQTGLVGLWSFNGQDVYSNIFYDRSGYGNNANSSGNPVPDSGKTGQAFKFDGVDDVASVPDAASLDLSTAGTVSAWIKPSSVSGVSMVMSKAQCHEFAYYLAISTGKLRWAWDNNGDCTTVSYIDSNATVISANIWTHVVAVHTSSGVTLYVNGSSVPFTLASGSYSAITNSSKPLRIGAYVNAGGAFANYYNGLIDDLRIYNRALSSAEVQALYDLAK